MRSILLPILFACSNTEPVEESVIETRPEENDTDVETLDTGLESVDKTLSEGTWAFSSLSVTNDTCGMPDESLDELTLDLALLRYDVDKLVENNYVFTLVLDDGFEIPNTCTVTGDVFECEDLILPIPVRDSTITETYTIGGIVDSEVRITGVLNKHHLCEGPDCADLAELNNMDFPCDITMDFTYNYFD